MRIINTIITTILTIVMCSMITACSSSLDAGVVINKNYQPEYTVFQPSCAGYNTSGGCMAWVQVPIHADQKWTITFEQEKYTQNYNEEKPAKRTIEVSQSLYETVSLGDQIVMQQDGNLRVNNNTFPIK